MLGTEEVTVLLVLLCSKHSDPGGQLKRQMKQGIVSTAMKEAAGSGLHKVTEELTLC